MKKSVRICHFSSVHPADDVRIFHKECVTLASNLNLEVHLMGNGVLDVGSSNVIFHSLGPIQRQGRLKRMLLRGYMAYRKARQIDAEIYHFHDPELLPWGLLLKLQKKIVIYDSHEDLPRDILTKAWIPRLLRRLIAALSEAAENFIVRRLDCVIAATPFIRDRFISIGAAAIDINNYPVLGELSISKKARSVGVATVCYTGAISEERGARQMVDAISNDQAILLLAGSFSPSSLRGNLVSLPGWKNVRELGQVKRDQLQQIYSDSIAGLVLFHPVPNNVNAQPNKIFEYMSAGLPVIASDFPLWRNIIDDAQCGLCINPLSSDDIASAIKWVADNPDLAEAMGRRGVEAVRKKFNWGAEADKLHACYQRLIEGS